MSTQRWQWLLLIVVVGLLPSCGNGSSATVMPPSPISVRVAGTLSNEGDVAIARATQGSSSGPFTYASSNGKVLAFSLSRPGQSTRVYSRIVAENGSVFVVATGIGTASVTVSAQNGVSAAPDELQNVRIQGRAAISISPSALHFSSIGSAHARSVTVAQSDYSGPFTQRDTCSSIATIEAKGSSRTTFLVTPIGNGSCYARFFGKDRQSTDLPIDVFALGKVVISPSKLAFKNVAAQSVKVSQSGYTGSFSESDTCAAVAGIAAVSNAQGTAQFTVSPIGSGSCTATFTGGGGEAAVLAISASLPNVVVSPAAMHFQSSNHAQTVHVSQKEYEGIFTERDNCAGIATVTETADGGGRATYAVSATSDGSCTVTFAGGFNETGSVAVSVALHGPVVVTPSSLHFDAIGSAHAQTVTVTQRGSSGTFGKIDDCAGVATIVSSGKSTYKVTPTGDGACTAQFVGAGGQAEALTVLVETPGAINASPAPLVFDATGSGYAAVVSVTQPKYHGSFSEHNTCNGVASIVAQSNGGGNATYLVTPLGGGVCDATFAGGNSKTFVLGIAVELVGPVTVTPSSLYFTATGSSYAKDVSVSQSGFSGAFDETNDCAGIATVVASTHTSYRITPVGNGACTVVFAGARGESAKLAIEVAEPGNVVVAPAPLSFRATGSEHAIVVTVTQPGYYGAFTERDTCGEIATVIAKSNAGGNAEYAVTPVGQGNCQATFIGANSKTFALGIAVDLPEPVIVSPSSLHFNATGSAHARSVRVTQAGYSGPFQETDDCGGIATITAPSAISYLVTPVGNGACNAFFAGADGQVGELTIEVLEPGNVVASPAPLSFLNTGPSQRTDVTVTQASFSGSFTESDTCSGIATITALTNGGGTATYAVVPQAVGTCVATFHGGSHKTFNLAIAVTKTGFGVQ